MSQNSSIKADIGCFVSADESDGAQEEAFRRIGDYVDAHSMHDLIELLEDQLVSVEDRVRNRATTLLADLFCQKTYELNGSVLHLYTVFFSHRLSDYPSVIPSLQALIALTANYGSNFDSKYEDVVDIFQTVFRSLHVPEYAQTVRHKVYLLFKGILNESAFMATLEPHGAEILDGIVYCIEEEKDPRCLLEVFYVVHSALKLFYAHLHKRVVVANANSEEHENYNHPSKVDPANMIYLSKRVFDALSCYFPITFTPPPNDTFGITTEMLITSLENCLCFSHVLQDETENYQLLSAKRKLDRAETLGLLLSGTDANEDETSAADDNAIVRIAIPYMLEQLTAGANTDLPVAKVHAIRALTRILRSNPLSFRCLGLVPPPGESYGDFSGSVFGRTDADTGVQRAQLSEQDAQLMDMVDDSDDRSDLYITDAAPALRTVATENIMSWSRQPHQDQLLQTLKTLGELVYAILVTNDSSNQSSEEDSGVPEVLVHALTLIGELTRQIVSQAPAGNISQSDEWKALQGALLEKVVGEITENVNSPASRAAVNIAYAIARTGGDTGCTAVLNSLASVLIKSSRDAHTLVHQELLLTLKQTSCALTKVTSLPTSSRALASSNNEDAKLSASCEMLAQLISCVGESNILVPKACNSHSNQTLLGTTSSCSVLGPFVSDFFEVLASFMGTYSLDMHESASQTAANPFAAVKASFSVAIASENENNPTNNAAEMLPPVPTVLALVGSISAMCELLQRVDENAIEHIALSNYLRTLTSVGLEGVPAIVSIAPTTSTSTTRNVIMHAKDNRACATTLYNACRTLLSTIVSKVPIFSPILRTQSVSLLVSAITSPAHDTANKAKIFGLLGAVASNTTDKTVEIFTEIALVMQITCEDCLTAGRNTDRLAELESLLLMARLSVEVLVDVFPAEKKQCCGTDRTANTSALKAKLLANDDTVRQAPVLRLIYSVLRYISDPAIVETGIADARCLVQSLYELTRRVTFHLPAVDLPAFMHITSSAILAFAEGCPQTPFPVSSSNAVSPVMVATGLLCCLMAAADKDAPLFRNDSVCDDMINHSCAFAFTVLRRIMLGSNASGVDPIAGLGPAQLLAVLINKTHKESQCINILSQVVEAFDASVAESNSTIIHTAEANALALIWATRAVSMRKNVAFVGDGSSSTPTWQEFMLSKIVVFLSTATHSKLSSLQVMFASELIVLTSEEGLVLTTSVKSASFQSAMFWKQKLWSRLFAKLTSSNGSVSISKLNILAVCAVVRGMPSLLLQDALLRVVEVVVAALSSTDSGDSDAIITAALSVQAMFALEMLLSIDAHIFIPYLNVVIPAVMKASKEAASARVRASALESLMSLTESISYARLHPFKAQVSRGLISALDDRKKAVRVLAGAVRNKWLVMK